MTSSIAQQRAMSAEERDRLILEHLPQVRWIAASIHEKLPAEFCEEDLVSTGILGLIAAIDNFDPTHKASLRTYAEYRIRGAILDSLRGLDGIPPHKRKKAKQLQAAIQSAEHKLQRLPSDEDIAEELGITLAAYHEWLLDVRGVSLGSLDAAGADEDGRTILRYVADERSESPALLFERTEMESMLAEAIESIPYIEKVVIDLYFRQELTLAEIARVVNLHTSRISQLKMQAVLRIRAYLDTKWPAAKNRRSARATTGVTR